MITAATSVACVPAVDLPKNNYLEFPRADTWGVVMRKEAPLAQKKASASTIFWISR